MKDIRDKMLKFLNNSFISADQNNKDRQFKIYENSKN